jgi:RNA-directed DNA polymerase
VNTSVPWPTPKEAEARVLGIQTKLHRWATDDPDRRFDDLYNLVCDPAFLLVAWRRVRGNKGARTAGVDGQTAHAIETGRGVAALLEDLRAELKAQRFEPLPVRERMIPKPGTRTRRRLGIPVVRDRVVQGALKLVLEPIYEADFKPCSYGFPPSAEPMTPSPRSACWRPPPMSGRWTATSRRALTKSRTPVFWVGCGIALGTSASWVW